MNNYFDGSSFSLTEIEDVRTRLVREFRKNINSTSVVSSYSKYPNWWNKTKQVIMSCFSVASETGQAVLVAHSREGGEFKQYRQYFLSNPISFKTFSVWAMYQSIQNAELKFIEECKGPRNEIALTAKLTAFIGCSASKIQVEYEKHLHLTKAFINLSELELQVQNREQVTGADFALILEWKNNDETMNMCPILFQAKRVTSELADISQKNNKVGYQFNVLKEKKNNSMYLFYHCDTQKITETPRVVTVKNVDDIEIINVPSKTSAVDDVLSLSIFMLDVMINPSKFKIFNNRSSALNSILNSVKEDELASVFSLSVDEDAGAKYKQEYSQYLSYKNNIEN